MDVLRLSLFVLSPPRGFLYRERARRRCASEESWKGAGADNVAKAAIAVITVDGLLPCLCGVDLSGVWTVRTG